MNGVRGELSMKLRHETKKKKYTGEKSKDNCSRLCIKRKIGERELIDISDCAPEEQKAVKYVNFKD